MKRLSQFCRSEDSSALLYAEDVDTEATEPNGGAPLPEYSESGIDLSLIDWFLSLTPAERFDFWEGRRNDICSILELNGDV